MVWLLQPGVQRGRHVGGPQATALEGQRLQLLAARQGRRGQLLWRRGVHGVLVEAEGVDHSLLDDPVRQPAPAVQQHGQRGVQAALAVLCRAAQQLAQEVGEHPEREVGAPARALLDHRRQPRKLERAGGLGRRRRRGLERRRGQARPARTGAPGGLRELQADARVPGGALLLGGVARLLGLPGGRLELPRVGLEELRGLPPLLRRVLRLLDLLLLVFLVRGRRGQRVLRAV
mmetsp:Transcript_23909/g.68200  ORF Transcript_23909/g.68200 Transcript_23909/m.68200 type:complete len:232 (-) Transcript_23909:181-876(-)